MTFRERMASNFAEVLTRAPREMPSGFSPDELWADGDKVTVRHAVPGGRHLALACTLTDNKRQNSMAIRQLYQSIWQMLEMIRLERTDEVEEQGAFE